MKKLLNAGWKILLVEIGIAIFVYFVLWIFAPPLHLYGAAEAETNLNWVRLWMFTAIVYIIASFRFWKVIEAGSLAVRTIFGEPVGTVEAGLPIVPPGIGDIILFPSSIQQKEFPAEPEKIFRGPDDAVIPEGMRPPTRITFGLSLNDTNARAVLGSYFTATKRSGETVTTVDFNPNVPDDALSSSRVTAEINFIVRWRIHNAVSFITNIGTQAPGKDPLEEVNRQMEDEMVVIFNSLYPRMSVAQAAQNIEWMNAVLFAAIERRIQATNGHSDEWGIDLEGAAVKPINFNHNLNTSISGVAQAAFEARSTVIKAEGAAQATILGGVATAKSAQALEKGTLTGKGQGIAAAAKSTGLTPADIIAAETAQTIGKGDGTIILGDSGFAGLMAVAKAVTPKPTKP